MRAEEIIATHPDVRGSTAKLLIAAIEETLSCAQTCTSCADACLAEDMVERLRQCVRLCLDCADICATTGLLATRRTGSNEQLIAQMLSVCATACHLCAEECERHAAMHDHCRICAEACRACAEACQRAIGDVGGGPSDMVIGSAGNDPGQDADAALDEPEDVEMEEDDDAEEDDLDDDEIDDDGEDDLDDDEIDDDGEDDDVDDDGPDGTGRSTPV